MHKIPKSLRLPAAYMERVRILLTIIRDHIATLIIVIQSIKSSGTMEDAAVTRLENHKTLLNHLIKSPEYIHRDPVAPIGLILTTEKLCASTAMTLLESYDIIERNKTLNKYNTSFSKENPSPIAIIRRKRALAVAPLIIEWDNTINIGKSLGDIHETLFFLLENINPKSPKYLTPVSPASLVPPEAPQEA